MLTSGQLHSYAELGYCRLEGAFPPEAAARMEFDIWHDMARRLGVRRDDPTTWNVAEPRGFQRLTRSGVFSAIAGPPLREALAQLLGPGSPEPREWAQPLVTFPSGGTWDVPRERWHLDFPATGISGAALGMKWLAYPAIVAVRGGGTLVVAGSHRLVARYVAKASADDAGSSSAVRSALCSMHGWFRELLHGPGAGRVDQFMGRPAECGGVHLQVIELVGHPGDIVLFDPWLFHAPAPNSLAQPRIMLTGGLVLPVNAISSGSVQG